MLRAGMGPKWDYKSLGDFAAGSYANMAATMPHYVEAKGTTVVQVHGVGPFVVNYVNPGGRSVEEVAVALRLFNSRLDGP